MNSTTEEQPGSVVPTPEEISALAYHIYEHEGFPDSCAERHWREAETLLREKRVAAEAR